ncbi:MoaD/ThiS family protein [Thermoanaerobacterium sp. DL9XJH110]|uniref:MoaD/ThiS family protein n=1 Tax=Thermoanaerobacterium sp. DL9XJH110 TaxID=3386643 RepID=UPI003BB4F7C1
MGKVTVQFSWPLNAYTEKDQVDLEVDGEIKIKDLEKIIIERFPGLNHSSINLKYIYYVVDNKTLMTDKEATLKEGQEVRLYQPAIGG